MKIPIYWNTHENRLSMKQQRLKHWTLSYAYKLQYYITCHSVMSRNSSVIPQCLVYSITAMWYLIQRCDIAWSNEIVGLFMLWYDNNTVSNNTCNSVISHATVWDHMQQCDITCNIVISHATVWYHMQHCDITRDSGVSQQQPSDIPCYQWHVM